MNEKCISVFMDDELEKINAGLIPVIAGAFLVGLGVGFGCGFNAIWNYLNTPIKMSGNNESCMC